MILLAGGAECASNTTDTPGFHTLSKWANMKRQVVSQTPTAVP